ncbi:hypothetical protein HRD49_06890 [Corallococcus exiguus]|uniref:hypothetical protein n=1 Tax=Corallococcus exiguus TaxID=83462 RepID=UPI0015611BFE|nr:hypothetical protein [Corallococcus exiguus]NRD61475.1 hypothetical protein [Corallococcus exiguus]
MGSPLPTPEERREQVRVLVRTCQRRERGLLRLRLYRETPTSPEDAGYSGLKARCAVCWTLRPRHLQLGEVKERPVATCRHPACERLWRTAKNREQPFHERSKAALLATFAAGPEVRHA